MTDKTMRPARIPDGTRVHVRSDHFSEECDAVIREAVYDEGWIYRVEVTGGGKPEAATNEDGSVWVCEFELQLLP